MYLMCKQFFRQGNFLFLLISQLKPSRVDSSTPSYDCKTTFLTFFTSFNQVLTYITAMKFQLFYDWLDFLNLIFGLKLQNCFYSECHVAGQCNLEIMLSSILRECHDFSVRKHDPICFRDYHLMEWFYF